MVDGIEINRMVVVGTIHVLREDMERLDEYAHRAKQPFIIGGYPEGCMFFVNYDDPIEDWCAEWKLFSAQFHKLVDWARAKGFDFIRIDRDGPEVEGLEKFEW